MLPNLTLLFFVTGLLTDEAQGTPYTRRRDGEVNEKRHAKHVEAESQGYQGKSLLFC